MVTFPSPFTLHPSPACAWLLLLTPLAASLLILLFGVRQRQLSAALALGGLLVSFGCTAWLFFQAVTGAITLPFEVAVSWIALPDLSISFGVLIDQLSLLMCLVVTGVGSGIFLYSTGYMHDDHAYSRYFGMLSLFAFSMLTIVLATNFVQLFLGWELVGFCSYMLIGHWYAKPAASEAGKKAFMVNRVADFGFMLGILLLWALSSPIVAERSVHFQTLQLRIPSMLHAGLISLSALTLTGLLLFCGPIGKSAQVPLHVWLPDAMEGPTPVSALIHAATMVAAGIYMLCRTFWLFAELPTVLTVIAWVGGITALLPATLALAENDLKRILAYSTLSQLGYMVMAVGLGGPIASMYHLTTHAFFKALLFLAAGSVIHGLHEQDIRKLGGLWHSMRWTSLSFLVGGLALAGVPGLSGFFSKDEILALAHEHNSALYWLATIVAGLTAFYTARAWFVAFAPPLPPPVPLAQRRSRDHEGAGQAGKTRGHHPAEHRGAGGHESPPIMLAPLVVLSALAIMGGYLGIPHFLGQEHAEFHWDVALISLAAVASGLTVAWLLYCKRAIQPKQLVQALALPHTVVDRKYWFDEVYSWYVASVQQKVIAGACAWVERVIIIGAMVNGTAWVTQAAGRALRRCQTGVVQAYVLGFVLGVIGLLTILR